MYIIHIDDDEKRYRYSTFYVAHLSYSHIRSHVCSPLCPPFHYVHDGFSSFHCIRPRTQWNDCSLPIYPPFHYVRSVINRPVVSAVIQCYLSIMAAGNLRG